MERFAKTGRQGWWLRWLALGVAALLAVVACAPGRGYEAALVLKDISAGVKPSRLKATTPEPKRQATSYRVAGRTYQGDLYRPGEEAAAALVLVPGAAEQGRDDPRLVAFAMTLARVRFLVLVPDIESLRELKVRPGNVRDVGDALRHLADHPEGAGRPLGAVAFSYAVGPTLLAAARPPLAGRVDFILAVGGYYDLEAVLTFATTGEFEEDGRWRRREPNRYGKWVFVAANLERLDHPGDRRLFWRMIERKRDDLEAPVDDLAAGLTPAGQNLYRFITNRDRGQVDDLIAALPAAIRADIAALDLSRQDLSSLQAHLILVHGRNDPIIPPSESRALARALPPEQTDLFLARGLMHVDVAPGLLGSWTLWRAVLALLRARDGVL